MPAPSKFRTLLFWLHLSVGVAAGAFIVSMAGSGILLAYRLDIIALAERDLRTVTPPTAGALPLPPSALVAAAETDNPGAPLRELCLPSGATSAAMFKLRGEAVLFVNPYTGSTLGHGSSLREFFSTVETWHVALGIKGAPNQPSIGNRIVSVVVVAYFMMVVTGLILWIPRPWSWFSFRAATYFQPRLKGRARDWNWHNVAGIWCAPIILLVTGTGTIMANRWASDVLFFVADGEFPPPPKPRPPAPPPAPGAPVDKPPAKINTEQMDAALALAKTKVRDWQWIYLRMPSAKDDFFQFTIDRGERGTRPDLLGGLILNRAAPSLQAGAWWDPFDGRSAGKRWRTWARYFHSGEVGGLIGESIAVVGALAGLLLVWTGFAMAWRRMLATLRARPRA